MERFYEIIMSLYRQHGENIATLSAYLEINRSTLRKWINREAIPRIDNVENVLAKIGYQDYDKPNVKDGIRLLTDSVSEEMVAYGSTKKLMEENARLRSTLEKIQRQAQKALIAHVEI